MTTVHTLMAAEIAEAPQAVARQLAANRDLLTALVARLRKFDPPVVVTIARGSSDHAALYLKYLVEICLGLPCASIGPSIASVYNARLKLDRAVAVTISQSGRSPDIVAMQRAAATAGALTIALVNDTESPVAQDAAHCLPLGAGPERAVAATKSMIAALVAAASLVARWGDNELLAAAIEDLPGSLDRDVPPPPVGAATALAGARSAFVLGRGATFAIASEAALKLKETCALHAEAFSAAEVLHGPAALIEPGFPVVTFMPQDAAREATEATLHRLAGLGAHCLTFDTGAAEALPATSAGHALVTPIVMIRDFYVLAEAIARMRGRDPDRPPHLSKVTQTR